MAENAKTDVQFKMGEIQVLMDSDRKIYALLHFLTETIFPNKYHKY